VLSAARDVLIRAVGVLALGACAQTLDVGGRGDGSSATSERDGGSITAADGGSAATREPRTLVDGLEEDVVATACALGPDGVLHIVYTTASSMRYLTDAPGARREVITSEAALRSRPSIAVREGIPWASYIVETGGSESRLEVAHRAADGWGIDSVATHRFLAYIAPIVATPTGLWVGGSVWWSGTDGSQPHVVFAEHDGTTWGDGLRFLSQGEPQSAAVDSLGLVQFTTYRSALTVATYLAVVRDERTRWVEYRVEDATDRTGVAAMALGAGDRPHVVHSEDRGLVYAYSPREEEWQDGWITGSRTAFFALGLRGDVPLVAYYDAGDLVLATRDGSLWQRETVDEDGDVGLGVSMAIDGAGRARIVYFDATRRELRIVER
jgi:hypothetical protein